MFLPLLVALAQNPTIPTVQPGVYDQCRILRNERDVGEAPRELAITVHELQNYTHQQVTGRFEGKPGQKVHWISGPLMGEVDATYIARPNQPPRLRLQGTVDGTKTDLLCAWSSE